MKDFEKIKLNLYDFDRNKIRSHQTNSSKKDITYINNVTNLSQKNKCDFCVTSKEYKYLEQKEKL